MDNEWGITLHRAANAVIDMADIMNCDYETVWKKYTHPVVKDAFSWKEIEEHLKERGYEI